ncbi:DedA family protein [Pandoraea sp. NE5]|nr:DedA family protein [Pandoraea sp. NE5]
MLAMDIANLVQSYGYLAVATGTFLEGETILVMAGFAAYRGHLALPTVILIGTLASFIGDQLYFQMGRRYGPALLARFPSVRPRAARAQALLWRHHLPLILSIRFLYGLRIAGPMAIGMSEVPWLRFFVLNLMGAAAWASVIAGAGFVFGQALTDLLANAGYYETLVLAAILLCGALGWLYVHRRHPGSRRA